MENGVKHEMELGLCRDCAAALTKVLSLEIKVNGGCKVFRKVLLVNSNISEPYLAGQRDLVSRLITPVSHIGTPIIANIN